MGFDLRTADQKKSDKIKDRIRRELSDLFSSYIPVKWYEAWHDVGWETFSPKDGEYFFADRDLMFIHCMSFNEEGIRMRKWVQVIQRVDRVHFDLDID